MQLQLSIVKIFLPCAEKLAAARSLYLQQDRYMRYTLSPCTGRALVCVRPARVVSIHAPRGERLFTPAPAATSTGERRIAYIMSTIHPLTK